MAQAAQFVRIILQPGVERAASHLAAWRQCRVFLQASSDRYEQLSPGPMGRELCSFGPDARQSLYDVGMCTQCTGGGALSIAVFVLALSLIHI